MIRLNLFMIWFLHFISLLSVICRYYRQNSSSRIIVVLVYTVSTPYFVSLTPLPGGRNHCQYQCGAGGHARSFVRHPVLYPVSERGDHHGRRNLPHYLAFRTEHSVADDVPVDLFQQGCIRLFGFMRQYLLELGEHPFA